MTRRLDGAANGINWPYYVKSSEVPISRISGVTSRAFGAEGIFTYKCSVDCKNGPVSDEDIGSLIDHLRKIISSKVSFHSQQREPTSHDNPKQNMSTESQPTSSHEQTPNPTPATKSKAGSDSSRPSEGPQGPQTNAHRCYDFQFGTATSSSAPAPLTSIPSKGQQSGPCGRNTEDESTSPSCKGDMRQMRVEIICSVDLSGNSITGEGIKVLMNFLTSQNKIVKLKCLKLYKNFVDDTGAKSISEYLSKTSFPLEEIHLSHNKITNEGASILFRAFSNAKYHDGCASPTKMVNGGKQAPKHPAVNPQQSQFVYPRFDNHSQRFLPIWVRLEYNFIRDPGELIREWNAFHSRLRSSHRSPNFCVAERNSHVKDPHCSPIRCVYSQKREAPLLHLYSFYHQGASLYSPYIPTVSPSSMREVGNSMDSSCGANGGGHSSSSTGVPFQGPGCARGSHITATRRGRMRGGAIRGYKGGSGTGMMPCGMSHSRGGSMKLHSSNDSYLQQSQMSNLSSGQLGNSSGGMSGQNFTAIGVGNKGNGMEHEKDIRCNDGNHTQVVCNNGHNTTSDYDQNNISYNPNYSGDANDLIESPRRFSGEGLIEAYSGAENSVRSCRSFQAGGKRANESRVTDDNRSGTESGIHSYSDGASSNTRQCDSSVQELRFGNSQQAFNNSFNNSFTKPAQFHHTLQHNLENFDEAIAIMRRQQKQPPQEDESSFQANPSNNLHHKMFLPPNFPPEKCQDEAVICAVDNNSSLYPANNGNGSEGINQYTQFSDVSKVQTQHKIPPHSSHHAASDILDFVSQSYDIRASNDDSPCLQGGSSSNTSSSPPHFDSQHRASNPAYRYPVAQPQSEFQFAESASVDPSEPYPLHIFVDGSAFLEMKEIRKNGCINPFSLPGLLCMCRKKLLPCQNSPGAAVNRGEQFVLIMIDAMHDELCEITKSHPLLVQRITECKVDIVDELVATYGIVERLSGTQNGDSPLCLSDEETAKGFAMGLSQHSIKLIDFVHFWATRFLFVPQLSHRLPIILTANPTVIKFCNWISQRSTSHTSFGGGDSINRSQNLHGRVNTVDIIWLNRIISSHYPILKQVLTQSGALSESDAPVGCQREMITASVLQYLIEEDVVTSTADNQSPLHSDRVNANANPRTAQLVSRIVSSSTSTKPNSDNSSGLPVFLPSLNSSQEGSAEQLLLQQQQMPRNRIAMQQQQQPLRPSIESSPDPFISQGYKGSSDVNKAAEAVIGVLQHEFLGAIHLIEKLRSLFLRKTNLDNSRTFQEAELLRDSQEAMNRWKELGFFDMGIGDNVNSNDGCKRLYGQIPFESEEIQSPLGLL